MRGHWLYTEIIESCKHVKFHPAHSSTDICQRDAMHQRPEGRTLLVKWALQTLLGDSLSLLLADIEGKGLV